MKNESLAEAPLHLAVPPEILLVEDDRWSVQLTSEMLGFLGCRVVVVGSGLDALNAVNSHAYAMILMDCRLPEMNGLDATRAIRESEAHMGWRATPIVALTASVMANEVESCLSSGMNHVLRKPVSLKELRAAILKWGATPCVRRAVDQRSSGAGATMPALGRDVV